MRSPQKVGQIRGEIVVYNDTTPVTGLVNGDFTKLLSKDGVDDATAITVTEIANGRYTYTFTPGAAGYWVVLIRQATYNLRGWQDEYDVSTDGLPSINDIVDGLLKRDLSNVEASAAVMSVATAMLKLVSKFVADNGSNIAEIYRTNGTTIHARQAVTHGAITPISALGKAT
jgi:hypothetical protein